MAKKQENIIDLVVIGGGINGVGIARDAAGRGLSVLLCEQGDLAGATSSSSTKLIHGGLRYLEHYEFRLVRDALKEREVLLKAAPHIIWPLEFVLPHVPEQRPIWMIRLGLFLYDFLGGRKVLNASRGLNFRTDKTGKALQDKYKRGFSYADCWVEDSRLVVLNAVDAAEKGAGVFTRTECTALEKSGDGKAWNVHLHDHLRQKNYNVQARCVVNAAGPWVEQMLRQFNDEIGQHKPRLVKGSHIIVPRLYEEDHAYILQHTDERIVFVIPYEKNFSLIGTTDVEFTGEPDVVEIDDDETNYLCDVVNNYLKKQISPKDVLWSYSGVRPLVDDGDDAAASVTRDYILDMENYQGLPILSVYGGKLTTYRKLAEQAVNEITEVLGKGGKPWTKEARLPGGEITTINFENFEKTLRREYGWMPIELLDRYARAYGERVRGILKKCRSLNDLGIDLGDGVYEIEIVYLMKTEWARSVDDVLWRRSKLGLHVSDETKDNIQNIMEQYLSKPKKDVANG